MWMYEYVQYIGGSRPSEVNASADICDLSLNVWKAKVDKKSMYWY